MMYLAHPPPALNTIMVKYYAKMFTNFAMNFS